MTKVTTMTEPGEPRPKNRLVGAIAISLATLFSTGAVKGYFDAHHAAGGEPSGQVASLIALAIGAAVLALYLRRTGMFWSGWSARKRRYWASMGLASLIGAAGAYWTLIPQSSGSGPIQLISGPLPRNVAIGTATLWVVGLAFAMMLYHRAIDDHEKRAWLWAGLAGWYAFVFPIPAWWLLHRAALVPPVDAMLLFILSLIVNSIVYVWLKFR